MVMLFTLTSFGQYAHKNATLVFYKLESDVYRSAAFCYCIGIYFMISSI